MSHRLISTLACPLLLLTALARADEPVKPSKPTADRVKVVRHMYAKLPCDILGFTEPANRILGWQKDGRLMLIILEDANGKKLAILRTACKTRPTWFKSSR